MFTVEFKLLGNTSSFAARLPRIIKDKEYDHISVLIVFVLNNQNKVIFLHILFLDKI